MSTPSFRDGPSNFAHVFNVPLPSLLRMGFLFFVFSLETWDSLRLKYPKKYKNPNIWRKKGKKKHHSQEARQGHIKHVRKFQGLSLKTAWILDSEGIWVFMLEPACTFSFFFLIVFAKVRFLKCACLPHKKLNCLPTRILVSLR